MELEGLLLRRLAGQGLLAPKEKLSVASGLCGVQAQFPSYALHALRIRSKVHDAGGEGLVRNWSLRGTLHLFPEGDLPLYIRAEDYRKNYWDAPNWWNSRPDWALSPERQRYFTEAVLEALSGGPRTREELRALCRAQGMTPEEERSMFHPWGGGLRQLCERGFMHYAADGGRSFRLSPEFEPLPEAEARLELARRYFTHYGPATVKDAAYFFGTTQAGVKKLLPELPVETAEFGGRTYLSLGGAEPEGGMPRCIFLAGFDPLMLGYEKRESLFLPPERLRDIFSLAGMVRPALLVDGRVAGRWSKKGKKLLIEPFSLSRADRAAVREAAAALWEGAAELEFLE